jgi:flagellar motility protein MotE (MotC chaperone)
MSEEFDFGFTAVDEEELGLAATPPTPPAPSVSPDAMAAITAQIADLRSAVVAMKPATFAQVVRVEEKIDRVLNAELHELNAAVQSQGESLSSVLDEVEERTNAMRDECKEKLQAVERLILPLLTNLMKNPEKSYIKWEGRAEKIAAQIDKITAVTRSYGV